MSVDNVIALNARDDLLWIVAHWGDLLGRLRPGGNNALTGMPGGGGSPSPIDLHVSDLIAEIEWRVARHYANALIDETTNDAITTSHMPELLAQVAARYGHFTAGEDRVALQFCDDASDYRDRVRKILERPAPPTYVGPCRTDNCDGELYVREHMTSGSCKACGAGFTLMEQREWLAAQMEQRLMTLAEIPRALKVLGIDTKPGTVRKWAERERLVEVVDGLYRLADAKALAERGRVGA